MNIEEECLAKSIDQLDLEIGRSILAEELGSKEASDREARSTAHRWLLTNIDRFRSSICSSPIVCEQLMGKNTKSRNELFAAVMDALLQIGGLGPVPVASLTARLLHYGLENLCPNIVKDNSHE